MSSVSTNYDYNAAMDSIRDDVEAYCETHGIDPDDFIANLDGNITASIFDNPTLEAYFQLAYMQLVELLYPEVINSLEAEVGDVDFDTLYANSDDEFNEFITSLIEDDPEIMALYATQAGGESEGEYLLNLLSGMYASADSDSDSDASLTADAQALANTYNLGEGFDWVIDQEEMFTATETAILDRLAEYDQSIIELVAALESGDISDTYFEAEMQNIYFGRETLMAMLQQVTDQKMSLFEMISKMYDKANEMQNAIINNIRAY